MQGPGRGLVVARVSKANDWINRNYHAPGFPAWSWKVTEFLGFADRTAEEMEGRPSQLEREFAVAEPSVEREIGFWSFTVARELGPAAMYLSAGYTNDQVQFSWSGVWTNAVYSIEGAESLTSMNWTPVVTGLVPGKTNLWSMPLPAGLTRFYRLRAGFTP